MELLEPNRRKVQRGNSKSILVKKNQSFIDIFDDDSVCEEIVDVDDLSYKKAVKVNSITDGLSPNDNPFGPDVQVVSEPSDFLKMPELNQMFK